MIRRARFQTGTPEAPGLTISEENALTGTSLPSVTGAGNSTNQGFCREFSVQAGNTANFSVHGSTVTSLDIYRIGYYGGSGARLVTNVSNTGTSQGASTTIPSSNSAITCTGWSTTAQWAVPEDATSGFYIGVVKVNTTVQSYIPFVVRRDDRPADIMVKTSDSTWGLAYNQYNTPASPLNGKSYYGTYNTSGATDWDIQNRAHAATYHRPITTRAFHVVTYWRENEAPLIRWLERNGYDLSYTASKDWRDSPSAPDPATCSIYISSGHDEYWSVGMRDRWEALRDAGKHLLFMSGNEVFWRTRYGDELSEAGTGDVMWCFKDTMTGPGGHTAGTALDPVTWTGTWKDTRQASPEPEELLTGTDFRMNGINYKALSMTSTDPITDHAFWRGTTAPTSGITVNNIIGFEADDLSPQLTSTHRATLAATSHNIDGQRADDNGENYNGNGTLNWGVGAQRYPSGAVVVGFGTCGWSWGLDDGHDTVANVANTPMRQATMNLLTDLGAVAATPQSGLSVPSAVSLDNYGVV